MMYFRPIKTHALTKLLAVFLSVMLVSCVDKEESPATGQTLLKHKFLSMGEASGTQRVYIKPNGVRIIDFEFNDRGRGPKNKTVVKLDENFLPVSFSSTGHNYSLGEIKEEYWIDDKNMSWSSFVKMAVQESTMQAQGTGNCSVVQGSIATKLPEWSARRMTGQLVKKFVGFLAQQLVGL